jgi:hypothetical protein
MAFRRVSFMDPARARRAMPVLTKLPGTGHCNQIKTPSSRDKIPLVNSHTQPEEAAIARSADMIFHKPSPIR